MISSHLATTFSGLSEEHHYQRKDCDDTDCSGFIWETREAKTIPFFQPTKSKEDIDDLLVAVSGRFIMQ